MENLAIRFYDISVSGSDSAGNDGSDTCKVVIISSCSVPSVNGCSPVLKNGRYYYNLGAVHEAVQQSQTQFQVAKKELLWNPKATERPTRKPSTKKPTTKPTSGLPTPSQRPTTSQRPTSRRPISQIPGYW
jgi:hypothetical protein